MESFDNVIVLSNANIVRNTRSQLILMGKSQFKRLNTSIQSHSTDKKNKTHEICYNIDSFLTRYLLEERKIIVRKSSRITDINYKNIYNDSNVICYFLFGRSEWMFPVDEWFFWRHRFFSAYSCNVGGKGKGNGGLCVDGFTGLGQEWCLWIDQLIDLSIFLSIYILVRCCFFFFLM